MDIEEIKKAIDGRTPLVITESGEIEDPSEVEGEEGPRRPTVKPDRWY